MSSDRNLLGLKSGEEGSPISLDEPTDLTLSDSEIAGFVGAKKLQGPLKKIRTTHHRIAQLMAQGLKDVTISQMTGFSQSRLSILKSDPAFSGLVQHYLSLSQEAFVDVQTRLLSVGLDAVEILHERMLDEPDEVSDKQLLEVATFAFDRSGHAPVHKSMSTNLHGTLPPDEISRLKAEAKERSLGHVTTKGNLRPSISGVLSEASVYPQSSTEGERRGGENLREEGGEVPDSVEQAGGTRGKPFPRAVD